MQFKFCVLSFKMELSYHAVIQLLFWSNSCIDTLWAQGERRSSCMSIYNATSQLPLDNVQGMKARGEPDAKL